MTFETCLLFMLYVDYGFNNNKHTILPKVFGRPLLITGLTTLVISMSTNLNVKAYKDDIRRNCVLLILLQQFGQDPFLF